MNYLLLELDVFPKIIMAHSFSTRDYAFSNRISDFIELVLIEEGEWKLNIHSQLTVTAFPGDLLLIPPGVAHDCHISAPGRHHVHSTLGIRNIEGSRIIGESELLRLKYLQNSGMDSSNFGNQLLLPFHIHTNGNAAIREGFKRGIREFHSRSPGSDLMLSSLFTELSVEITRLALESADMPGASYLPPSNLIYAEKIVRYLEIHYREAVTLEAVAAHSKLNKHYMCTLFKQTMHETITGYLNRIRVRKAKELLVSDKRALSSLCREVGIQDEYYFSRLFKKLEGMSPIQFRNLCMRDEDLPD